MYKYIKTFESYQVNEEVKLPIQALINALITSTMILVNPTTSLAKDKQPQISRSDMKTNKVLFVRTLFNLKNDLSDLNQLVGSGDAELLDLICKTQDLLDMTWDKRTEQYVKTLCLDLHSWIERNESDLLKDPSVGAAIGTLIRGEFHDLETRYQELLEAFDELERSGLVGMISVFGILFTICGYIIFALGLEIK